jgi:hypothetical protein
VAILISKTGGAFQDIGSCAQILSAGRTESAADYSLPVIYLTFAMVLSRFLEAYGLARGGEESGGRQRCGIELRFPDVH